MLGSLAVVLGLIYLVTHFSRRWLKGGLGLIGRPGHISYIRVVETRHMSPKKSLLLVEVAGEYLLLSNSSEGISLIKPIDMLEEIEILEVSGEGAHPLKERFQEKLEGFMARLQPPRLMKLETGNEQ
jgi:flagellar protein FliO/FliZ